ncbi:hypothetical protein ANO11243_039200 [Dothideomycetidae sp. 11243]|nr:hypothetical protein ANO11243_039200 [fungal sp. No.11243]
MGRERQKAKNRSSISKVKHRPKSKKKILQNAIIAKNWDQKETLSQNYRRLGLASRLNYPTGGTEKLGSFLPDSEDEEAVTSKADSTRETLNINQKLPTKLNVTETRVERDPETGAIISVIEDTKRKANPLNDPLNDLSEDEDEADGWEGLVNEHGLKDGAKQKRHGTTETVRELEEVAARPAERRVRKQSDREQEWVARLVDKHGDNYKAMSRDAKLNVMQQSEGDIKRRVARWRTAQTASAAS